MARSRGVTIERTGDGADTGMLLDAGRLEEVFQTLLENACHHSPPQADLAVFIDDEALDLLVDHRLPLAVEA